jgi:DNA-binding response OmpR family regulator
LKGERAVKGRLLLVEDDPGLTELLRWHFEREEFDVDHTPDGERRSCSPRNPA